jgi:hypothetical protein
MCDSDGGLRREMEVDMVDRETKKLCLRWCLMVALF